MPACRECPTTAPQLAAIKAASAGLEFCRVARQVPVSRLQRPRAPAPVALVAVVEPHRLVSAPVQDGPGDGRVFRVPKVGAVGAHDMVSGLHTREELGGDVALTAVVAELERIHLQWQARASVLRHRLQRCCQHRRECIGGQQHRRAPVFQQQGDGLAMATARSLVVAVAARAARSGSNTARVRGLGTLSS